MKLLANGCSMTHGQELVTDGYDPANTQLCYAKKIFDEYEKVLQNISNENAKINVEKILRNFELIIPTHPSPKEQVRKGTCCSLNLQTHLQGQGQIEELRNLP